MGLFAYAATETYNCSVLGDANVNPLSSVTVGQVTFTFAKGGNNNNAPAYYTNGSDIRMYANNTMTVTAAEGYKIDKLVFTYTTGWNQIGKMSATLGNVEQDETGLTWTGEASSFTMTVSDKAELGADTNKAGQFRFTSVEVTYSEGDGETDPDQPGQDSNTVVLNGWNNYTWTGDGNGWTANVKGFTITTNKAESTTDMVTPDQWSIRVYSGASITLTAPEGVKFAEILVGLDSNTKGYAGVAEGWTSTTGSSSDMKFTMTSATAQNSITFSGADSKQLRIASITVYTEGDYTEPEVPETPTPEGELTVAQALAYFTSGQPLPTGNVKVKGIISEITEVSADYGNATFTIKDALSDANGLQVYRTKWIDGENFTGNEIAAGGVILVEGILKLYNGTRELSNGVVISYDGESGETPEQPDEPVGESVTFNFADITSLTPAYDPNAEAEYDVTDTTFEAGIITLEGTAAEGANNKPRLYKATSGAWTYRFYKDNTITIACDDSDYLITSIVFKATNLDKPSVVFTNGTYANGTFTPTNNGVEYMTISKNATGDNPTITSITVYYSDKAGVEGVEADNNAPVEFFNLQGIRVANPENGIFIRRQGNSVTKVLVK